MQFDSLKNVLIWEYDNLKSKTTTKWKNIVLYKIIQQMHQ